MPTGEVSQARCQKKLTHMASFSCNNRDVLVDKHKDMLKCL